MHFTYIPKNQTQSHMAAITCHRLLRPRVDVSTNATLSRNELQRLVADMID